MATSKTVSDYIQSESVEVQKVLKRMRAIVRKAAPKATEKLAWGMPTFYCEGIVVTFAAFKNHLSLFPGAEALDVFGKVLQAYQTSKGTVQFPYGKPLPAPLITKIVKFRVKRNLALANAKQRVKVRKKKKASK